MDIKFKVIIIFIFLMVLVSCGGGSGGAGVPALPEEPKNIIDISSHYKGSCVIQAQGNNNFGSVWCWGNTVANVNKSYSIPYYKTPVNISAKNNIKSISLSQHLCVVSIEGELLCQGTDANGEIGIEPGSSYYKPNPHAYYELTPITATKDWESVSSGFHATCGIKKNGSLWCWGLNSTGKLATNDTINSTLQVLKPTPILKSVATTDDSLWSKVTVGGVNTCALKQEGSLWCWGLENEVLGIVAQSNANSKLYPQLIPQPSSNNFPWIDITLASGYACGIIASSQSQLDSGTLWCWGSNIKGEVAQAPVIGSQSILIPTQVGGANNWLKVRSNGNYGTCAINTEQQLFCWGENANYQLGKNLSGTSFVPVLVDSANKQNWIDLGGGFNHYCGVRTSLNSENKKTSSVWCWGANDLAQLGNGKTNSSYAPKPINPSAGSTTLPAKWKSISASFSHFCALKEEVSGQSAWCWGNNSSGDLGINSKNSISVPIQEFTKSSNWLNMNTDQSTCGVQSDKSIWCWGYSPSFIIDSSQVDTPLIANKISLAAKQWKTTVVGFNHVCGIDSNDELYCWGRSTNGESGVVISYVTTLVAINIPNQAAGSNTKWSSVATNYKTVCGIKANDQSLWCWGNTEYYQFTDPTTLPATKLFSEILVAIKPVTKTWLSVSVMARGVCAIDTNQKLFCWGGGGPSATGIDISTDHVTYPNGIVRTPTMVNTNADIKAGIESSWKKISSYRLCAIKSDDSLWCSGSNEFGQLGINREDIKNVNTLTQVQSDSNNWISVASAGGSSCGIKADNSIWCWGQNNFGQLGDGKAFVTTPVKIKMP